MPELREVETRQNDRTDDGHTLFGHLPDYNTRCPTVNLRD
jgi:hypothetical protein